VFTTVDHADIRGLVITVLVSVERLLRSRDEGRNLVPSTKVALNTGPASLSMSRSRDRTA
jgi:hypothetical protein